MTRHSRSWITAAFLMIALAAPDSRAFAYCYSYPGQYDFPACAYQVRQSATDGQVTFSAGGGITQPLDFTGNAVACSLSLRNNGYGYGELRVVQWDPQSLAPDPTSVALRTRSFDASDLDCGRISASFNPPIVTRLSPHLADPPRETIALNYESTWAYSTQTFNYATTGSASWPQAYHYDAGTGLAPLPGAHPVLGYGVCGGDASVQMLSVAQSVMTANVQLGATTAEFIQRFRVPAQTRLHRVEFAFGPTPNHFPIEPGTVTILDAEGSSTPPSMPRRSIVEGTFYSLFGPTSVWESSYDLDQIVTLEPDHDYWLSARVNYDYQLYARTLTGSEGPDFTANIGPLYRRATPGGPWLPLAGKALSFRLIGEPVSTVGVTFPSPSPASALRLRVAPNPTRGATFVSWTGARGSVRFEVIDTRGRRVALGRATGAEGRWAWDGTQDDGRAVPPGVYFVRATDAEGTIAVDRVVLVR